MNRVAVPHHELPAEVLQNLMEEFVTRDGTDYGSDELALEERVTRLRAELDVGRALIVYDAELESVNIMTRQAWDRQNNAV